MNRVRSRLRGEEGNSLIIAIMVASISLSLCLVVVADAMNTARGSGVDRQQSVAVAGAEAGVDSSYAAIQNSGLALPCSWPASGPPAQLSTQPDTTTVQATIKYQTGLGVAHCPLLPNETALAAVITSTAGTQVLAGGSTSARRTMESAVNLTPVYGNGFDSAMFADDTLSVSNGGSINGNVGSDAHVYTNGTFVCENGTNRDIHGSVFAQGDIVFGDKCNVDGEAWAGGSVTGTKSVPTTIGGAVRSGTGSVTLKGGTQVGGQLFSNTTISWPGCTPAKCISGASPGLPQAKPFPILRADAASLAEWTDPAKGGFTTRTPPNPTNCTAVTDWIVSNAPTWSSRSIIVTSCKVAFGNNTNLNAKSDLAIFARGGVSANQQTNVTNAGTGTRNVYWIVPYENGTSPCTTPTVTSNQHMSVAADTRLLMYSPCTITVAQNSNLYGQIYSGTDLLAANSFDLTFRPVPVYGIAPESRPTVSYTLDVLYKREDNR